MVDRAEKEAERAKRQAEKLAQMESQVSSDFDAKKKNGSSGSAMDQLKVWLDNAPFKSQNAKLKRDTMFAVLGACMALKQKDIDDLCANMTDKLVLTLSKYLFKAFELIATGDKEVI